VQVSDWVVAEAYYALQYHYQVGKRETLEALKAFLATPGVEGTGAAAQVLATRSLDRANPGFVDRLIYRDYLSSGAARMATFEKAAKTWPDAVVLGSGE
jgi:predicted nucleic acid-binding protein